MTDIDVSNVTMTVVEPEPPTPDPFAALEAEVAELKAALTALLGGAP
jgi:hypothetical protein